MTSPGVQQYRLLPAPFGGPAPPYRGKAWDPAGRDDDGRDFHADRGGVPRFLRHRARGAGERRLSREPYGRRRRPLAEGVAPVTMKQEIVFSKYYGEPDCEKLGYYVKNDH